MGSLIPGLMLAGFFAVYVVGVAIFNPEAAPALPEEARQGTKAELARQVVFVMVPPLSRPGCSRQHSRRRRHTDGSGSSVCDRGDGPGSRAPSAQPQGASRNDGGDHPSDVHGSLPPDRLDRSLPGGKIGPLIVANLSIFILGFFIDFFEIAFIVIPLLVPSAELLGIDMVWFGVMIGMNLQTSFLTPPFGFAIF